MRRLHTPRSLIHHDHASREQLELVLHKLGLQPFVLMNEGGAGLTIIEALERQIGAGAKKKCFGIVLLTPDDLGYSKAEGELFSKSRARQNVILEMGMLLGSMGRENVVILKKGELEIPSDAQGIIYIEVKDHVKDIVPRLVQRLVAAGIEIDTQAMARASA